MALTSGRPGGWATCVGVLAIRAFDAVYTMEVAMSSFRNICENDAGTTRNAEVLSVIGAPSKIALDDGITIETDVTCLIPVCPHRIVNTTQAMFFRN